MARKTAAGSIDSPDIEQPDSGIFDEAGAIPLNRVASRSIGVALERRALDHQRQSHYADSALLTEIAVAAGALKQKTQAARGRFTGETAALIEHLHEIL